MALILESEPIIGGNHVIHSSDFPCAIEVNVGGMLGIYFHSVLLDYFIDFYR